MIYRARKQPKNGVQYPHQTLRHPANVPYVVDNLWEWVRPEEYPDRRRSAFASPSRELAIESVHGDAIAFEVEFLGAHTIAQLTDYDDAKYHPECRSLKKLLMKLLGAQWLSLPLSEKSEAGRLFLPCLGKDDVEGLFQTAALYPFRDEVRDAVRYWSGVRLIEGADDVAAKGEIFFEYPGGYRLKPLVG
ncbi:MAG TPA: hypothetical protein VFK96_01710 [Gammaproteobacteria bacterium]|nr:hypothetical protein [Gammaproteobacteria bacterium]